MSVSVRALGAADAQAYWDVRYATLSSDPFAFGTTAERFAALPLEQVAERVTPSDTRVSFGAFLSGPDGQEALVGILTLVRLDSPGFAHRADVLGVAADLATDEGTATVLDAVPHVDVLVNNLGIFSSADPLAIDPSGLRQLDVRATYVDGHPVWQAE